MTSHIRHTGFITSERAHLVALAQGLASALPVSWLHTHHPHPQKPLTIAVNGTSSGGKKIFPDIVRDTLLGQTRHFAGRIDWDEIHTGTVNDQALQITFINTAWRGGIPQGYGHKQLDNIYSDRKLTRLFNRLNTVPAISFVHNANQRFARNADIQIWLESKFDSVVRSCGDLSPPKRRMSYQDLPLRQHFNRVTSHNIWTRWCEIKINNKTLAAQPEMQDFMGSLHVPHSCARLNPHWYHNVLARVIDPPMNTKDVMPLYGVNLPQP